jgi:O-antigen/teichoic acid export membrane protein
LGGTLVSVFSKLAFDDEHDAQAKPMEYTRLGRGRKEVATFQIVTLLPLCAFMFTFPVLVLRAIYGQQYDAAAGMVQHGVIALAVNIWIFHGGLHVTSLAAIGKQRLILKNRLCWGAINIVANYFLIRSYGALGAIIGTNWINTLCCATEWYFARKYIGYVGNRLSAMRIVAITIVSAVGAQQIMRLIEMPQEPILNVMLALSVFFAIVLALFRLLRVPETTLVITRFKKAFAS